MKLQALIFDCDGVLVDTERDGHRVAFNQAFDAYGIALHWSVEEYKELLLVAGGKERMRYDFERKGWPSQYPDHDQLILDLHQKKTALFMKLIASGKLPLRPGILRLVDEALEQHVTLAVCSTSNEKSVNLILEKLMGPERKSRFSAILAGDVVSRKKPDPEIYLLCRDHLHLEPTSCLVIEDSRNGLLAATGAGFPCLVTTNGYTMEEDFSEAVQVVPELGEKTPPGVNIASINKLL